MKRQNPPQPRTAFAEWMLQNVRREIAASRVRSTVDETGTKHAIN